METNVPNIELDTPTATPDTHTDDALSKYTDALIGDGPGPKPKPKSASSPTVAANIDDYVKAMNSDDPVDKSLMGQVGEQDPSKYNFSMKPGLDSDLLRAQNQSWEKQVGLGLINAVPNIATDIVKSVGQLGTLMQFGDNRTYSNALIDTMDKWQNPFGDIYQEHPDKTFDVSDPAWWIKQGMGLVEMTGQFAAFGGGVGSLFEKAAMGAADLAGGGARLTKALLGAGQVATSAALSYTIGAQMGAQVFQRAYNTNYNRLMSQGLSTDDAHQQATHIAAQAASSTVQLNTALGFGLNFTSVMPAFKQADDVLDFLQKEGAGARAEGESLADYKSRLQSYGPDSGELDSVTGKQGLSHKLMEGAKQSAEGLLMHFSQQAGNRIGDSGKTKGFIEQFDELEHLFSDATSSEGVLNAILGVAGGVLNTAVLERIPLHSDYVHQDGKPIPLMESDGTTPKVDEEGKPLYQTKMYSSRDMATNQRMAYFESARDAIVSDIDHITSKMDSLQDLASKGKSNEIQPVLNDLLAVQQLHSITMGTADNLVAQYQEIAKTDNETDLGVEAQKQSEDVAKQQQQLLQEAGVQDPSDLPEEYKAPYEQLDRQRKQLLTQSVQLSGVSEAMQKGFTTSMKDNSYKERAEEASKDMLLFQDWHKDLSRTFGNDPRNIEAHVPEIVLHKQIQNHLYTRLITKLDGENLTERTALESQHGPVLSTDNFNSIVRDYNRKVVQSQNVGTHFNDELAQLHKLVGDNNTSGVETMLSKYKIDYPQGEIASAARELSHKLADLRDSKLEQSRIAHDNIANSLEFQQWKEQNPTKALPDYIKELQKRTIQNAALSAKEEYTDQLKGEQSILQDQINKIKAKPREYSKSVLRDFDLAQQRQNDKVKAENATFVNKDREKAAVENLSAEQQRQVNKVYQQKLNDIDNQVAAREAELALAIGTETRSKLGKLLSWVRDPQERKLREELLNLKAQREFIHDKISSVLLPPDTPEEIISGEELTALPSDMADSITSLAGQINSQLSVDDIRKQLSKELSNKGIDIATITPDSIDAAIVRALTANKLATEKDASEVVSSLDKLIATTGNPELVKETVDEILNEQKPFSYDALSLHQLMGFVDQPTASKIMQTVSDLLNGSHVAEDDNITTPDTAVDTTTSTPTPLPGEDTPDSDEPEEPEPPEPPTPTPDGPSDPPVVGRNTAKDAKPMFHLGSKAIDGLKIQRLDVNYTTDINEDSGEAGEYKLKSITSQINRTLSEAMLEHGKIVPGTAVTFSVDKEWSGRKNVDSQANTTTADDIGLYLDKEGKIPNAQNLIDEVPIKIMDTSGQVLGYLPRVGWILAKNEGAVNYRNIGTTEEDPNNPETQAARVRAVRKQIVNFFNSGSKDISTVVQDRGPSHLIMNVDEKGNLDPKPATKMLPSRDLELGVVDYGNVKTGKASTSSKELAIAQTDEGWMTQGSPVAVVPMPDGKHSIAPLFNRSIEQYEINTMLEAVRAYLAGDSKIHSKLNELTGFDTSTAAGLRNFINQHYTYTNRFALSALQPSMDPAAVPKFLFNITNEAGNQHAEISVGTSYSGRDKMIASLQGNQLHPEFVRQFTEGMKGRYKNVVFEDTQRGMKGLNSPGSLNEVVISKGAVKLRKAHDSYNDYVKSFSDTPVNGTNELANGEHVYGVHSNTTMDMDKVMSTRPDKSIKAPKSPASIDIIQPEPAKPKTKGKVKFSKEDADLLDSGFMDMMPSFESSGVTLDSLRELHTFTPEQQHNGKTPVEVLAELKQLGLEHLPQDFNPFIKC